jgi:Flp pilus assembly secretin CpaC
MAALCTRGRASLSPLHWLSAALVLIAIAAPAAAQPMPLPSETIVVFLDQARLLQLPDRAANVVVGNPLIADLSIQPGGLTVITGKSYGITNVIVTDRSGVVLMEKSVEVSGSRDKTARLTAVRRCARAASRSAICRNTSRRRWAKSYNSTIKPPAPEGWRRRPGIDIAASLRGANATKQSSIRGIKWIASLRPQ